VEDVQGDDFNFWMGIMKSPMGVTRQWWVLIIALLENRTYVKDHKVFEVHKYTPLLTVQRYILFKLCLRKFIHQTLVSDS